MKIKKIVFSWPVLVPAYLLSSLMLIAYLTLKFGPDCPGTFAEVHCANFFQNIIANISIFMVLSTWMLWPIPLYVLAPAIAICHLVYSLFKYLFQASIYASDKLDNMFEKKS